MRRKVLKRKSVISVSVIAMSLLFGVINVSAKEEIPQYMEPGTIIKVNENEQIEIISGGYSNKRNKISDNIVLPELESGMIISYDGRGLPNKILNNGVNESYKIDYIGTEEIQVINDGGEDFPEQRFAQGTTVWKYSGWITWFTDRIGQEDHVLQDWDCAIKMTLDNPKCGTPIRLRDESNYNNEALLSKWDVGALPNAVLDIRPNKFKQMGYVLDLGHFKGRYGHFTPYQ